MKKIASVCIAVAMIIMSAVTTRAGGSLESFDITAQAPSPIAGHILARVVGLRWDARSMPLQYRVNSTLNPIPNPLGAPFLSVADASAAFQASFDQWNSIPTSFINMQVVGTTGNPGLRGFDFVNELTFRTAAGFNAIASSPSVNLISDSTLSNGDDLDGDGDSDVSSLITTAGDVDSDGDIEFPAGFYKAGTILDNDVQYNTKTSNGFRFTVDPAQADTVTRSVDLITVSVHEFGHSFGLSHVLNNQDSAADGNGATMFPFIDTGDPASELSQRSPNMDDIAFASFFYPEGTAASGPAALQPGDVAFNKAFGLITGELRHGVSNQPIAGGSVFAVNRDTKVVASSAFSGTTNLSFNPANGGLFFINDPAIAIPNGNYVLPVPKGNWDVRVEAVDGEPVPAANISFTTQIGNFFGQQNFIEEFFNNNSEGAVERDPGDSKNVHVNPGKTETGINITTNRVIAVSNFGALNSIGFINSPAGRTYAVAFPAAQIGAINPGQDVRVQAGLFNTFLLDASVPAVFADAYLTTGVINPDGSANIDLVNPLDHTSGFLGQDGDFASFFFKNPHDLGVRIRAGIADGSIQNLFLVLRIPTATPFAGVSGQPPLVGLNNTGTIFGLSFLSNDGGVTFNRLTNVNFRFSLLLSEPE
ncbi:MAG TPA: matrixin family metalloprotease [Blastocatellia bacterium]|nr:matrixin family metalloprotease [Blastocatellia bacterium]